jgi:hypothetical protein
MRRGLGEVAVCAPTMVGGSVSGEVAVIPLLESMDPEFVMYALPREVDRTFCGGSSRLEAATAC